jgi:hypothetical protein
MAITDDGEVLASSTFPKTVFLPVFLSDTLAGAKLSSMFFLALGEESIVADMELLDEPYPISELEEKVPQEECTDPCLVTSAPENLASA